MWLGIKRLALPIRTKNSEEVALPPDPTVTTHFQEGLGFEEWIWGKWAGQRKVEVPRQEQGTNQGRNEQSRDSGNIALRKKGVVWVTNIKQVKARLYQAKEPNIDPIVVGKSLKF